MLATSLLRHGIVEEIRARKVESTRATSDKARVTRNLVGRAGAALRGATARAMRRVRDALQPKSVLGGFAADLTRTREELLAENAALRQQLVAFRVGRRNRGFVRWTDSCSR